MAGTPVVQCCGASYHLADRKAAIQSAINLYPQRLEGDTLMMCSAPGRVLLVTMPGAIRGSHVADKRWFVAAGAALYEVDPSTGSYAKRGDLSTAGFVGMAHNNTQLAVVDGANLYVLTLADNTFARSDSEAFRGSRNVSELDGYMIFVAPTTDQFYISAVDDASTLDALDFSSADSSPGEIVACLVSHRQIWFLKTQMAEIWIDSGNQDFPFVRYQSFPIDVGAVGPRAAIIAADTLFWIGCTDRGTGLVYTAVGNSPQRVSNLAVEQALKKSTDLSQAVMWTYQIEGHEFVGISAPGMESTWVYDAAMPPGAQWHERAEWDAGWQVDRVGLHTFVGDAHFCGDDAGNLYRLDDTVSNLAGLPLVRERTWPHFISPQLEPTSFRSLELACTTGHGGNVTLEISNDGGETFGPMLLRSLGAIGRWMERVRWMPLGTSYNRVFRLRVSDDVPFSIHSAAIDSA